MDFFNSAPEQNNLKNSTTLNKVVGLGSSEQAISSIFCLFSVGNDLNLSNA
jgi:hypothetical protein